MKTTIKNFLFKKRFKILKSKKGFSLMELLIVVGIMGVISAIALPAYEKYRTNANETAAKAEARTIFRALQTCLASGSTTCVSSGDVDKTVSKSCTATFTGTLTGAVVVGTQQAVTNKGKCYMALNTATSPNSFCVASNIEGQTYCFDNTGGSDKAHGCTQVAANLGTCL